MNISKLFMEIKNKETLLLKICDSFSVKPCEIAYIGDDVNDIDVLENVGISAIPINSPILKKINPDYITKTKGGCGAFREFVDLILQYRK